MTAESLGTWYIAGHAGLVGSALVRRWQHAGHGVMVASRSILDLTDGASVRQWLAQRKPDGVVHAAGRVGGIFANAKAPAEFLYENLIMGANLIHGAWQAGIKHLLNFGSSCMYPRACQQPMRTDMLLTGRLEPTSEPYAVAKLSSLSLCASYSRQYGVRYLTAIPCTLYGPGDSFDPDHAHVLSAMLAKFHDAKVQHRASVRLWGSGLARREFLYVDDLAEASELLLTRYEGLEPVNIGSGESYTIRDLAVIVARVVGFDGAIEWDTSKPDGAAEKLLDSSGMRQLGWSPRTALRQGIEQTYRWFVAQHSEQANRTVPHPCVSS